MDTRNLIAFGMLLAVVVAGMTKGVITGNDAKEVIILLAGGVIGVTMPRRADSSKPSASQPPVSPIGMFVLLAGAVMLLLSCYHGSPPWPGDPTAPQRAQHVDGGSQ